MWIYIADGFYSAVEHRNDSNKIMVRCRAKLHAERLIEAVATFSEEPTPALVESPPPADYHWRVTITRQDWAQFVAMAALQMDYTNVKGGIAKKREHPPGYIHLMHDVWYEMDKWQTTLHSSRQVRSVGNDPFGDFDHWVSRGGSRVEDDEEIEPEIEAGSTVFIPDEPELGIGHVTEIDEDTGMAKVLFLIHDKDEEGNTTSDFLDVHISILDLEPAGEEDGDDPALDPEVVDAIAKELEDKSPGRPEPETYDSIEEYEWDGSWPEPVAGGVLRGR